MYKIGFIAKENIPSIWNDVKQYVEFVADMSDSAPDADYIHDGLIKGHYWLVAITLESKLVGVFVCSIEVNAEGVNRFFITTCCGIELSEIKNEIIEFMKEGAKNVGAKTIEWRGRYGFIRAFRDIARVKHVALIIDVE